MPAGDLIDASTASAFCAEVGRGARAARALLWLSLSHTRMLYWFYLRCALYAAPGGLYWAALQSLLSRNRLRLITWPRPIAANSMIMRQPPDHSCRYLAACLVCAAGERPTRYASVFRVWRCCLPVAGALCGENAALEATPEALYRRSVLYCSRSDHSRTIFHW